MNRLPVVSSNIASVGWEDGTLEVEFNHGAVYQYEHVPLDVAFMVATGAIDASVGRTFHRLIRTQPYVYQRTYRQ